MASSCTRWYTRPESCHGWIGYSHDITFWSDSSVRKKMAGSVISTYLGMKSLPSVPSMPDQVAAKVKDFRTSPICDLPRKAGLSRSFQLLMWTFANPGHLRFHTGTNA